MSRSRSRTYYAARWPYGRAVNDHGQPIREVYVFASRRDRDLFVASAGNNSLHTNANYTEALAAKELRASDRNGNGGYWELTTCRDCGRQIIDGNFGDAPICYDCNEATAREEVRS